MRDIQYKRVELMYEFEFRLHPVLKDFVRQLDAIAELVDAPLTLITSIARSDKENAEVGGVPTSLHVKRAGDSYVRAVDLRNNHYSDLERQVLVGALRLWAIKYEDLNVIVRYHGTGPHFHLEWRGP